MNARRHIRIFIRNRAMYNPETPDRDLLCVDVENFAGTFIWEIKEQCKERAGVTCKLDELFYLTTDRGMIRLEDGRTVAHYNIRHRAILETTSNPFFAACMYVLIEEARQKKEASPENQRMQQWMTKSIIHKRTIHQVLFNSNKDDGDTQPEYFPDVPSFVDFVRGHPKKGCEMSELTVGALWRMWEGFTEHDIHRRDPIRAFVHRYAIRLGLRPAKDIVYQAYGGGPEDLDDPDVDYGNLLANYGNYGNQARRRGGYRGNHGGGQAYHGNQRGGQKGGRGQKGNNRGRQGFYGKQARQGNHGHGQDYHGNQQNRYAADGAGGLYDDNGLMGDAGYQGGNYATARGMAMIGNHGDGYLSEEDMVTNVQEGRRRGIFGLADLDGEEDRRREGWRDFGGGRVGGEVRGGQLARGGEFRGGQLARGEEIRGGQLARGGEIRGGQLARGGEFRGGQLARGEEVRGGQLARGGGDYAEARQEKNKIDGQRGQRVGGQGDGAEGGGKGRGQGRDQGGRRQREPNQPAKRVKRAAEKERICDNCEETMAVVYCSDCDGGQVLCADCSDVLHRGARRRNHAVRDVAEAPRVKKTYVPQPFRAPYALLVALFSGHTERNQVLSMTEDELKSRGQPLTDTDLSDKSPGKRFGGFDGIEPLITKKLIKRESTVHPTYSLENTGIELGQRLWEFDIAYKTFSANIGIPTLPKWQNDPQSLQIGTRRVCLLVDQHEKQKNRMVDLLHEAGIPAQIRELKVCDYMWILMPPGVQTLNYTSNLPHLERVLPQIVERKTWDDFYESTKDNRFRNQIDKMKRSGLRDKFYLVEGSVADMRSKPEQAVKDKLKDRLGDLELHEGFHVRYTGSWLKTCQWLQCMTHIAVDDYKQAKVAGREEARTMLEVTNQALNRRHGIEPLKNNKFRVTHTLNTRQLVDDIFNDAHEGQPLLDAVRRHLGLTPGGRVSDDQQHLLVVEDMEAYNKNRQRELNQCSNAIVAHQEEDPAGIVVDCLEAKVMYLVHYDLMLFWCAKINVHLGVSVVRAESEEDRQRIIQKFLGQHPERVNSPVKKTTPRKRKLNSNNWPANGAPVSLHKGDYAENSQNEDEMMQRALQASLTDGATSVKRVPPGGEVMTDSQEEAMIQEVMRESLKDHLLVKEDEEIRRALEESRTVVPPGGEVIEVKDSQEERETESLEEETIKRVMETSRHDSANLDCEMRQAAMKRRLPAMRDHVTPRKVCSVSPTIIEVKDSQDEEESMEGEEDRFREEDRVREEDKKEDGRRDGGLQPEAKVTRQSENSDNEDTELRRAIEMSLLESAPSEYVDGRPPYLSPKPQLTDKQSQMIDCQLQLAENQSQMIVNKSLLTDYCPLPQTECKTPVMSSPLKSAISLHHRSESPLPLHFTESDEIPYTPSPDHSEPVVSFQQSTVSESSIAPDEDSPVRRQLDSVENDDRNIAKAGEMRQSGGESEKENRDEEEDQYYVPDTQEDSTNHQGGFRNLEIVPDSQSGMSRIDDEGAVGGEKMEPKLTKEGASMPGEFTKEELEYHKKIPDVEDDKDGFEEMELRKAIELSLQDAEDIHEHDLHLDSVVPEENDDGVTTDFIRQQRILFQKLEKTKQSSPGKSGVSVKDGIRSGESFTLKQDTSHSAAIGASWRDRDTQTDVIPEREEEVGRFPAPLPDLEDDLEYARTVQSSLDRALGTARVDHTESDAEMARKLQEQFQMESPPSKDIVDHRRGKRCGSQVEEDERLAKLLSEEDTRASRQMEEDERLAQMLVEENGGGMNIKEEVVLLDSDDDDDLPDILSPRRFTSTPKTRPPRTKQQVRGQDDEGRALSRHFATEFNIPDTQGTIRNTQITPGKHSKLFSEKHRSEQQFTSQVSKYRELQQKQFEKIKSYSSPLSHAPTATISNPHQVAARGGWDKTGGASETPRAVVPPSVRHNASASQGRYTEYKPTASQSFNVDIEDEQDKKLVGSQGLTRDQSQVKCGSCQGYGHKRTWDKCPNYYTDTEIARRDEQKENRQKRVEEQKRQKEENITQLQDQARHLQDARQHVMQTINDTIDRPLEVVNNMLDQMIGKKKKKPTGDDANRGRGTKRKRR